MTTGRNDPCPCGSGAKYKRCCLAKSMPDLSEVRAERMRELQPEMERRMRFFAADRLPEEAYEEAWEEFTLGREEIDPRGHEGQLFEPWFHYDWRPGRRWRGPAPPDGDMTIARTFLSERRRTLDEMERNFIEGASREPHSFYDVLESEPGRRLRLRDVFRHSEIDVWERSASRVLQPGDVIFARAARLPGFALLVGTGSVPLPPIEKPLLIECRRSLARHLPEITDQTLHDTARELRDLYFGLRDRVLNPPPLKLCNTDGDPLAFHTITYDVESARVAFEALKSLAKGPSRGDLLYGARYHRDGRLRSVELPWSKPGNRMQRDWDNTILGHLRIDDGRLTIEVNSEKRARRIQNEVRKRLAGRAFHLKTEVKSVEGAMRERARGPRRAGRENRRIPVKSLSTRREMRAIVQEFSEKHWMSWPDEPVPALDGKTPAEAVRDPDGREMVEALLMQFERDERRKPSGENQFDFARLRERLGLRRPVT